MSLLKCSLTKISCNSDDACGVPALFATTARSASELQAPLDAQRAIVVRWTGKGAGQSRVLGT
jgi:hypothetical protein